MNKEGEKMRCSEEKNFEKKITRKLKYWTTRPEKVRKRQKKKKYRMKEKEEEM